MRCRALQRPLSLIQLEMALEQVQSVLRKIGCGCTWHSASKGRPAGQRIKVDKMIRIFKRSN